MNVTDITGKRILFFSPAFFRYENLIADKMREMGADVDMYDVRAVTGALDRALLKISPAIFPRKSRKYYESIVERNKGRDYDYILIVKCDMTPVSILIKLRELFPRAKLCLYLWDSVDNIPGVARKFPYFDTLHSFDPNDCKKFPQMQFRPLFFADQFRMPVKNVKEYAYDISFLGTVHSDRYAVIRQVRELAEKDNLKCYWFLYLQSRFIYRFYKATKREFKNVPEDVFSFEKLSSSEISRIVDESRITLDIQHPGQTGLTMRTVEMLGMNKKLITTNASIKEYDFYRPENIQVIDRKNVRIDLDFLHTPYEPLSRELYEKYSLRHWILDVLS